ncbi:hypothetical protein [Sinanaerobacter chloroacetimidivorans]|uniref:hypothetical protein n=1 Tax=Sinanaerobacter chloroacetimidivorans TaxID=2818044 RepID=UPI001D04CE1A|nr:hypothetical protein [Sinanaerobacter chloroacetimidivorans]
MIYRVRITEKQYCMLEKQIDHFLKEQKKYKYNFLGLLGVLLKRPIKRENRYFCSQFVSEILMNSHVFKCRKVPELICTNELLMIENKEMIYEGFLNL